MSSADAPSDAMIEAVREVAEAGAAEALRFFRRPVAVESKPGPMTYDPVTEGDRAAERVMRARIEARFPDHGILGEEFGEKATSSPWRWVLDPIDGTRGFMAGTPTWTTLVGLEREGVPVVGAIAQPFTQELWWGGPGGTTHLLRGAPTGCAVSACAHLEDARIASTDPRPRPEGYLTAEEAAAFLEVANRCPVARFGHDAYAYGLLASGHVDLVVEAGLARYDVAALIPVVRGAGGRVTAWDGGGPEAGGRILAAATSGLWTRAQALLG
jgi:myo-inositol-1(or 4)-monophosphatase